MTNKFVSRVWTMRCAACYAVTHNDSKHRSSPNAASWRIGSAQGPVLHLYLESPISFHSILKGSFHNNICSSLISANKMQTGSMPCLPLNPNSAAPHLKITPIFFSFDLGGQPAEFSGFFRIHMDCVGLELPEHTVS